MFKGLRLRVAGFLGGSWVVISRVISPIIWVMITVTLLTTPLITTHEPLSRGSGMLGSVGEIVNT